MTASRALLIDLVSAGFDPYGRVCLSDPHAVTGLSELLRDADAIACESGCGAPLSCDTALIRRDELVRLGPNLLINNAQFAAIIRKRKAVNAREAIIEFRRYRELDGGGDADQQASASSSVERRHGPR